MKNEKSPADEVYEGILCDDLPHVKSKDDDRAFRMASFLDLPESLDALWHVSNPELTLSRMKKEGLPEKEYRPIEKRLKAEQSKQNLKDHTETAFFQKSPIAKKAKM